MDKQALDHLFGLDDNNYHGYCQFAYDLVSYQQLVLIFNKITWEEKFC